MGSVRVICPIHGLIKTIQMDCFWLGRPPMPDIDNAFCPKCGSKTTIERDEKISDDYAAYWSSNRAANDRYR